MFDQAQWQKTVEGFTKDWEQQAAKWWDGTLRDQGTLEQMRAALLAVCAAKERSDHQLEQLWGLWRLPSAADVERLYERQGELEDRLSRIEALLERLAEAKKA